MDTRGKDTRHRVEIDGRCKMPDGTTRPIRVLEISGQGCRFRNQLYAIEIASEVTLTIGQIGPLKASIIWNDGSFYGAVFDAPIHPAILGYLSSQRLAGR